MKERSRIMIPLSPEEVDALRKCAAQELRDPHAQARYILRAGLGLAAGPPGGQVTNEDAAARPSTNGAFVPAHL